MIQRYRFRTMHALLDRLVELIEEPVPDRPLLEQEHIIVPSQDLGNWLTINLARKTSAQIAANYRFYQPAGFVDTWSMELLDDSSEEEWNKGNLQWALFQLLPELAEEDSIDDLPVVATNATRQSLKWFRLAGHLADVYDQYMIYRPDWLNTWRTQPEKAATPKLQWQAQLWHRVTQTYPHITDRAQRMSRARKQLSSDQTTNLLPKRIWAVGLGSMSESLMHWMKSLHQVNTTQFNVLEWQPYIPISQEAVTGHLFEEEKPSDQFELPQRIHTIRNNWIKQNKDFFHLVERLWPELSYRQAISEDQQEPTKDDDPLHVLQKLLINPEGADPVIQVSSDDRSSLQIHATHSPLREVEVLYEQLLACFEKDPTLRPDDLLIVTPDLETYAPHLKAVFGSPGDENLRIPFHLSDPTEQPSYRLAELLIQVLRTAKGRFKVTEIMDLLAHPVIRRSVDLSIHDLDRMEQWMLDLNVRWGYDSAHRQEVLDEEHPISEQNSWQQALDRLWLGITTRDADQQLYHQRLSYDGVEGTGDSHRLGVLQQLIQRLWQLHQRMQQNLSLAQWKQELQAWIRDWFSVERDQEPALQWLQEQVSSLDEITSLTEQSDEKFEAIGVDILIELLSQQVLSKRHPVTRMAGRALISSMVPMRGIPAKVVALVGLNEGTFPGSDPTNPFDAMQDDPRPGDRSRRLEDRQLFADALLSAQDQLLITYTGRDQRNDEEIPPSSLITELLDLLNMISDEKQEDWISKHPLHGFEGSTSKSETYLSSLADQNQQAFEHDRKEEQPITPLVGLDAAIPWDRWISEAEQNITLTGRELKRFYRQPLKYYCEQALGVWLREEDQVETEEEPYRIDSLSKYQIYNQLLKETLLQPDSEIPAQVYEQRGVLPHGILGRHEWRTIQKELNRQAETITTHLGQQEITEPTSYEVELEIEDHLITLSSESGYWAGDQQLVIKTGGKLKAKDYLGAWLDHLGANAAGLHCKTHLYGKKGDKDFQHQFVLTEMESEQAKESLSLFIKGLLIGRFHPLGFFPASSMDWAESYWGDQHNKDQNEALKAAKLSYHNEHAYNSYENESDDAYYQYFLGDCHPYEWNPELCTSLAEQFWTDFWGNRS
ncbi:MAG: exodeoxyribonuclease V subunit gamma [Bacteroidota bacterium]